MLDIEKFRSYCINKKGVTEEFPFGPDTLVFKVMGKMFALTGLDNETFSINLKCEHEQMAQWREKYPAVQPGYHMNKQHWNTVFVDGSITQRELFAMVDHSYDEVVKGMPKKLRLALENE